MVWFDGSSLELLRQVAKPARASDEAGGGGARGDHRWRRLAGEGQLYDDAIYCLRPERDLRHLLFYFFGHAD